MTIRIPIALLSLTNAPISMLQNGHTGIILPLGDGHIDATSIAFNTDNTVTIEGDYWELGQITSMEADLAPGQD